MRREELDDITTCLLTEKTKFCYFKDRFALMLLSHVVGSGRSVGELKAGRYGRLLRKPILKKLTARLPDGVLTSIELDSVWPPEPEVYHLTLGRWGHASKWQGNWQQTSRPGMNLVLHNQETNRSLRSSFKPYKAISVRLDITVAWLISTPRGNWVLPEVNCR